MADVYSLSIRADTTDVTRARQALDGLSSGAIRATKTTKQLSVSNQQLARTSRFSANGLRNTSLQLSQVAQQASATGNFVQALAIQLPDLALAFGPVGILVGAVAGGLLSFAVNASRAEEETENLADTTKKLVEELGEATRLQREFINAEFRQRIQQQNTAITEAEETIRAVNARLEDFRRAAGENVPAAVFESESAVKRLRKELTDAELAIDNANSSIQTITKNQEEFWQEVDKGSESLEVEGEQLDKLVSRIVAQGETTGKTAREIAIYEANLLGAGKAERQAINNAFDLIEAQNKFEENLRQSLSSEVSEQDPMLQRIEAQRRAQELLAQESAMWAQRIAQNQQTIQQQSVATVGASIGAMQSFFEQGSAEFIAFGLMQKGLMAGQAIMAANLAATLALTAQIPGDPTGPARAIAQAETIRTLGYLNAGLILATGIGEAIQGSRQMGGSVSAGGRYLVGENGPEVVTMGGSGVVTPSSVSGGSESGNDVIVNVNNAPAGTRTEERTDSQGRRFVDVFIADMSAGGPMSKSVQSTFGVRRQGR